MPNQLSPLGLPHSLQIIFTPPTYLVIATGSPM